MEDKLVGAWRLVSFQDVDHNGRTSDGPLGPDPSGLLIYTADGHVSVSMMPMSPGSTPHFMGYAGRWTAGGGEVVHRIEMSSRADWIGITQSREADLAGDDMFVHATRDVDGRPQRRTLHWRRVPAGD